MQKKDFMNSSLLFKDWLVKNSEKVKRAYTLIIENKYNIESEFDVLKVINIVDPESATKEGIELYSLAFRLVSSQLGKKLHPN